MLAETPVVLVAQRPDGYRGYSNKNPQLLDSGFLFAILLS